MSKPRVLVFSTIMPLPVNRGDSLRLFYTLQHLKSFADVCLVCLVRDWEPPVTDLSALNGVEFHPIPVAKREVPIPVLKAVLSGRPSVVYRFDTPRIADAVQRRIEAFQPDIYWGFQLDAYPFARFAGKSKRILDLVDSLSMHYALVRAQEKIPPRARLAGLAQPHLLHIERQAMETSDATLVSSLPNVEYLYATHGQVGNVVLYLNSVPDAFLARRWQPQIDHPPRLLFVGYLGYPPNEIAVRSVIENILPRVQAVEPDAQFIVCGGGNPALSQEYAGTRGVVFTGFIDDLVSQYAEASLTLVPVPYATGIQNKLLEAMAVGLPAVISEVSLKANGVTANKEVLTAASDSAMADAALAIIQDPAMARRLSDHGRAFIESHHTWKSQRLQIQAILQSVL